jgi:hypothetical protein
MVNAMPQPLYPWECPDNHCKGGWVWTGAENLALTGNHYMNSNNITTVNMCKMYLPSLYQSPPPPPENLKTKTFLLMNTFQEKHHYQNYTATFHTRCIIQRRKWDKNLYLFSNSMTKNAHFQNYKK